MLDEIEVKKNKLFETEEDLGKWGLIDPVFKE